MVYLRSRLLAGQPQLRALPLKLAIECHRAVFSFVARDAIHTKQKGPNYSQK